MQDVQDTTVQLDGGLRSALFRRTGDFVMYALSVATQGVLVAHTFQKRCQPWPLYPLCGISTFPL